MQLDYFSPVGALPGLLAFGIAFLTAHGLAKLYGAPSAMGRFASIDGLRGYLGFAVFLHHASIWYFYLRTDQWKLPPSQLFTHFGQSSVTLFFMITGCLFFAKLLDAHNGPIDWLRLYVSRWLRLAPLYYLVVGLMFLVVAYQSDWSLRSSLHELFSSAVGWLSFTFLGGKNLNDMHNTFTIVAGVFWSLPYEWAFYFSLPVLAHLLGNKPSRKVLWLSIAAMIAITMLLRIKTAYLLAFSAGCLGAWLAQRENFCQFARRPVSNWIGLSCIALAVTAFPSGYKQPAVILLGLAFILIAGGCTLFGLLTLATSRTLGEMTYSIYLLHGLLLYTTIELTLGRSTVSQFTATEHWILIFTLTPILLVISFMTFKWVEQPTLQQTTRITTRLRKALFKLQ